MQQIVECVMNVSEGRNTLKLETIARRIEKVPSAFLLEHSADPDHHRTIFSFIGTPSSIFDASFAAVKKAGQLIDMREHQGVHPSREIRFSDRRRRPAFQSPRADLWSAEKLREIPWLSGGRLRG